MGMKKNEGFDFDDDAFLKGEDDFDLDDLESLDDSKPAKKAARMVFGTAKSVTSGALQGIRMALRDSWSGGEGYAEAEDAITGAVSEVSDTLKDAWNEGKKSVTTLKRICLNFLPMTKKVAPKSLYDWSENFLKKNLPEAEEEKSEEQRMEESQNEQIQTTLVDVFKASEKFTRERYMHEESGRLMDRVSANTRHSQTMSGIASLDKRAKFIANFLGTTYASYLKKDLELKYRGYFVAKDTLRYVKAMSTTFEQKLEAIKLNAGLPEILKVENSDVLNKRKQGRAEGSASTYKRSLGKNVIDGIKEKLNPVKSLNTDILPMMQFMSETMGDMSDMMAPSKMDAVNGLLGQGAKWGARLLFPKFMEKHQGFFKLLGGDLSYLTKNFGTLANTFKQTHKDGLLGWIADFLPGFQRDNKIKNKASEEPTAAATFDNLTRESIITVIPAHLERIGAAFDALNESLGVELKEGHKKVWDVTNNKMVTEKEMRESIYEREYGKAQERFNRAEDDKNVFKNNIMVKYGVKNDEELKKNKDAMAEISKLEDFAKSGKITQLFSALGDKNISVNLAAVERFAKAGSENLDWRDSKYINNLFGNTNADSVELAKFLIENTKRNGLKDADAIRAINNRAGAHRDIHDAIDLRQDRTNMLSQDRFAKGRMYSNEGAFINETARIAGAADMGEEGDIVTVDKQTGARSILTKEDQRRKRESSYAYSREEQERMSKYRDDARAEFKAKADELDLEEYGITSDELLKYAEASVGPIGLYIGPKFFLGQLRAVTYFLKDDERKDAIHKTAIGEKATGEDTFNRINVWADSARQWGRDKGIIHEAKIKRIYRSGKTFTLTVEKKDGETYDIPVKVDFEYKQDKATPAFVDKLIASVKGGKNVLTYDKSDLEKDSFFSGSSSYDEDTYEQKLKTVEEEDAKRFGGAVSGTQSASSPKQSFIRSIAEDVHAILEVFKGRDYFSDDKALSSGSDYNSNGPTYEQDADGNWVEVKNTIPNRPKLLESGEANAQPVKKNRAIALLGPAGEANSVAATALALPAHEEINKPVINRLALPAHVEATSTEQTSAAETTTTKSDTAESNKTASSAEVKGGRDLSLIEFEGSPESKFHSDFRLFANKVLNALANISTGSGFHIPGMGALAGLGGKLWSGIKGAGSLAGKALSGAGSLAGSGLKGLGHGAATLGKGLWSLAGKAKDAIGPAAGAAWDMTKSAAGKLWDGTKWVSGKAVDLGKSIGKGIFGDKETGSRGLLGATKDLLLGNEAEGKKGLYGHAKDAVSSAYSGTKKFLFGSSGMEDMPEGAEYKDGKWYFNGQEIDGPHATQGIIGKAKDKLHEWKEKLHMPKSLKDWKAKIFGGEDSQGKNHQNILKRATAAVKNFFGIGEGPKYVDVYRKDDTTLGHPILKASEQEAGVFFADGSGKVEKTKDINKPVVDKDNKTLISQEDVNVGLVDNEGHSIYDPKKSLWQKIVGGAKSVVGAIGSGISGLWNKLFGSKDDKESSKDPTAQTALGRAIGFTPNGPYQNRVLYYLDAIARKMGVEVKEDTSKSTKGSTTGTAATDANKSAEAAKIETGTSEQQSQESKTATVGNTGYTEDELNEKGYTKISDDEWFSYNTSERVSVADLPKKTGSVKSAAKKAASKASKAAKAIKDNVKDVAKKATASVKGAADATAKKVLEPSNFIEVGPEQWINTETGEIVTEAEAVKATAKNKTESIKETVKDKAKAAKDKVISKSKEVIESVKNAVSSKKEEKSGEEKSPEDAKQSQDKAKELYGKVKKAVVNKSKQIYGKAKGALIRKKDSVVGNILEKNGYYNVGPDQWMNPETGEVVSQKDATKELVSKKWEGVKSKAKEWGSKAWEGTKSLSGKAWEGLKWLGKQQLVGLSNAGKTLGITDGRLKAGLGKAWEGTKSLAGKAVDKIKEIDPKEAAKYAAFGAAYPAYKGIKGFFKKDEETGESKFDQTKKAAKEKISSVKQAVKEKVGSAITSSKEAIKNVPWGDVAGYTAFGPGYGLAKKYVPKAIDATKRKAGQIAEGISNLKDKAIVGAKLARDKAVDALVNKPVDAVKPAYVKTKNGISNAVDKTVVGAKLARDKVLDTLAAPVRAIKKRFNKGKEEEARRLDDMYFADPEMMNAESDAAQSWPNLEELSKSEKFRQYRFERTKAYRDEMNKMDREAQSLEVNLEPTSIKPPTARKRKSTKPSKTVKKGGNKAIKKTFRKPAEAKRSTETAKLKEKANAAQDAVKTATGSEAPTPVENKKGVKQDAEGFWYDETGKVTGYEPPKKGIITKVKDKMASIQEKFAKSKLGQGLAKVGKPIESVASAVIGKSAVDKVKGFFGFKKSDEELKKEELEKMTPFERRMITLTEKANETSEEVLKATEKTAEETAKFNEEPDKNGTVDEEGSAADQKRDMEEANEERKKRLREMNAKGKKEDPKEKAEKDKEKKTLGSKINDKLNGWFDDIGDLFKNKLKKWGKKGIKFLGEKGAKYGGKALTKLGAKAAGTALTKGGAKGLATHALRKIGARGIAKELSKHGAKAALKYGGKAALKAAGPAVGLALLGGTMGMLGSKSSGASKTSGLISGAAGATAGAALALSNPVTAAIAGSVLAANAMREGWNDKKTLKKSWDGRNADNAHDYQKGSSAVGNIANYATFGLLNKFGGRKYVDKALSYTNIGHIAGGVGGMVAGGAGQLKAIGRAFKGNKSAMTDQELREARAKLHADVKRGITGAQQNLSRFEAAVKKGDWEMARHVSKKDVHAGKEFLKSTGRAAKGALAVATLGLSSMAEMGVHNLFGDNTKPMDEKELTAARKKLSKMVEKKQPGAKELSIKFEEAVEGENWATARKLMKMEDKGLLAKIFGSNKAALAAVGLTTRFGAVGGLGFLLFKSDQDKPLKEKEITEFRKRCEKAISNGSKTAETLLQKFNDAVDEQNWKKARELSNMKDKSIASILAGGLKKVLRYVSPVGWFMSDQDEPMSEKEIEDFRKKMEYLKSQGDTLAGAKLDKFEVAVMKQEWALARQIANTPHKSIMSKVASAVTSFVFGNDDKPMDEKEIQDFRDSMNRKIELGDQNAKRRLEAFDDAVGRQNWRKAREISDKSNDGIWQKGWKAVGKGLKAAWKHSSIAILLGMDSDQDKPMTDTEITQYKERMQGLIDQGDVVAKQRLKQFEDAVLDNNWKKARAIANVEHKGVMAKVGKGILNLFNGKSKIKEKDDKDTDESKQAQRYRLILDRVIEALGKPKMGFFARHRLASLRNEMKDTDLTELDDEKLDGWATRLADIDKSAGDLSADSASEYEKERKSKSALLNQQQLLLKEIVAAQERCGLLDWGLRSKLKKLFNEVEAIPMEELEKDILNGYDEDLRILDPKAMSTKQLSGKDKERVTKMLKRQQTLISNIEEARNKTGFLQFIKRNQLGKLLNEVQSSLIEELTDEDFDEWDAELKDIDDTAHDSKIRSSSELKKIKELAKKRTKLKALIEESKAKSKFFEFDKKSSLGKILKDMDSTMDEELDEQTLKDWEADYLEADKDAKSLEETENDEKDHKQLLRDKRKLKIAIKKAIRRHRKDKVGWFGTDIAKGLQKLVNKCDSIDDDEFTTDHYDEIKSEFAELDAEAAKEVNRSVKSEKEKEADETKKKADEDKKKKEVEERKAKQAKLSEANKKAAYDNVMRSKAKADKARANGALPAAPSSKNKAAAAAAIAKASAKEAAAGKGNAIPSSTVDKADIVANVLLPIVDESKDDYNTRFEALAERYEKKNKTPLLSILTDEGKKAYIDYKSKDPKFDQEQDPVLQWEKNANTGFFKKMWNKVKTPLKYAAAGAVGGLAGVGGMAAWDNKDKIKGWFSKNKDDESTETSEQEQVPKLEKKTDQTAENTSSKPLHSSLFDKLKDNVSLLGSKLKDRASSLKDNLKDKASSIYSQLTEGDDLSTDWNGFKNTIGNAWSNAKRYIKNPFTAYKEDADKLTNGELDYSYDKSNSSFEEAIKGGTIDSAGKRRIKNRVDKNGDETSRVTSDFQQNVDGRRLRGLTGNDWDDKDITNASGKDMYQGVGDALNHARRGNSWLGRMYNRLTAKDSRYFNEDDTYDESGNRVGSFALPGLKELGRRLGKNGKGLLSLARRALHSSILDSAKSIANNSSETAVSIKPDGSIRDRSTGGKYSVNPVMHAGDDMIHNHPDGSPTSQTDINSAIDAGLNSITTIRPKFDRSVLHSSRNNRDEEFSSIVRDTKSVPGVTMRKTDIGDAIVETAELSRSNKANSAQSEQLNSFFGDLLENTRSMGKNLLGMDNTNMSNGELLQGIYQRLGDIINAITNHNTEINDSMTTVAKSSYQLMKDYTNAKFQSKEQKQDRPREQGPAISLSK